MSARLRSSTTELEEMGEEATLTTSKLRALVQGLTGVDIQKDENTFKSIYDILLEIGKEWKNLTDIEQASLSEALFGKRNSQVGFSILNNVERLEEIYALAENSAGSAYEEQSKYLDSVQYKIDQFRASVESISNDILSSDFLKDAIGAGTSFVNILDSIIKNLGAIPSLIGVISAAIGTKWNIFGNFVGGFGGSETVLPITQKTDLGALASGGNAGIKALIKEYNNLGKTISQTGLTHQAFIAKVAEGNQDLATYFNKVGKDGKASFRQYTLSITATTVATKALQIATMALQGALFSIIGLGLSKVFEWVDGLITTSEEAIEKGEEARRKIEEINTSLKNQQKIVQDSGARFAELSQGINRLTGENISLSDEEYKEFLDISNQLVEVFPTLTHGYNDNGDAIVLLDGNVNTIIGSLNSLLETERLLANQQILDAMPDNFEGAIAAAEKYDERLDKLTANYNAAKNANELWTKNLKDTGRILVDGARNLETIELKLKYLGIEFDELPDKTGVVIPKDLLTDETVDNIVYQFSQGLRDLENKIDVVTKEKKGSISSSIAGGISAYLSNQFAYLQLDDAVVQNGIERVFNNIDWTKLKISDWAGATALMDKVLEQVVLDADTEAQFKMGFGLATQFNENEISWGDFQEKIQAFYNIINALDLTDTQKEEFIRSFNILFDIKTDKDNNPINEAYDKVIGDVTKSFEKKGKEVPVDIVNTIKGLYQNELDVLAKENINWDSILDSNNLDKVIQNIKDKANELSKVDFSIEYNRSDVEAATKGIKKIQAIFQDIYEKHEAGKTGSDLAVLLTDLEELKDASQKGEVAIQASEATWNDLFTTLADGKHEYEDMTAALNKLLTEYVTNTIALKNFDEAQAAEISTQLQQAGVTKESADIVVQALSDRAKAVDYAVSKNYDFTSAIDSETFALLEEAEAAGYSSEELARYILQEQLADGLVIDTTESVNNLLRLAQAANVTSEELKRLATFQTDLGTWTAKLNQAIKEDNQSMIIIATEQIKGIKRSMHELGNEISLDDFEFTAPFKFDNKKLKSSSGGRGGGSSKKEEDPWKEAYEKELAALNHLHEMELISDIQYYEEREKLNDKYFKDNEKYAEDYNKNLEEIYKGFQSAYKSYVDSMSDYWKKSLDAGLINFSEYCDQMKDMLESLHNAGKIDDETYYTGLGNYYGTIVENYDKAINAAQRVIKKRIDALNKEKEAIEKNYEAQKDVLQAQIDDINNSIDGRNKQIKAINKQIDAINKEIESYQTEIDKLNEANEERQAALDMQKALYELSRAENQRKDYVYNSEQGFVYEANSQDIKNAQDEIAQLEHDRIVRDLEKTISTLENSIEVLEENIETLEDEIETLEGNIDSLEDEMERLEKELDVLVEKYEEQINSLEEYSDSIGECANKWTEAQEDMVAASMWGSDWQNKILSQDKELVQNFESMYVEAQRNQAQANRDATNAIIEANNRRIESLKELQKAEEDAKQASNVSTLGGNVNVSNKTTPKDTSSKKETSPSTKPVKYAWYDPSSKRVVYEYGSGTKDAKPGYQEIAETGDEIIVDNNGNAFLAKGHQLHLFEGGEQVYSPSDTKELLNGKYIPIDSILPNYSSMLSKVMSYSISPANNLMGNNVLSTKRNVTPMKVDSSIHIDIGDIHITEVDNVTEVAKAIKNQLPNALLQELNRK